MEMLCSDWKTNEQGEKLSQLLKSDDVFICTPEEREYTADKDCNIYPIRGHTSQRVKNIVKWDDWINNDELDEMIIESIKSGPANTFFEALDSFNHDYSWHFQNIVEEGEVRFKLDVYEKSLRWKRGSYNHLKSWMKEYLLSESKRPSGINSIYQRVYDNMYVFERMAGRIGHLETMRKEALQHGFGRDIDEDAVLESWQEFKALYIQELMNDSIDFEYYVRDGDNIGRRDVAGIIVATMKKEHFKMNVVHGGEYQIAEIPYNGNVQIVYSFPLLQRFADYYANRNFNASLTKKGMMFSGRYANHTPYRFPWISGGGNKSMYNSYDLNYFEDLIERIQGGWSNCCWGGFTNEVMASFYSMDHNAIIMALTQWGTYYDNENSNPHNNIKTFHIGLEDSGVYEEDDDTSALNLIREYYDNTEGVQRYMPEWLMYSKEEDDVRPSDYHKSLVEQIEYWRPDYFIDKVSGCKLYGNELLDIAEYVSYHMDLQTIEYTLNDILINENWYDEEIIEDGGELEDQDGEISVPEGMEQWAGTRVVRPRAPGRFSNVLESTDETTRLERERIEARQRLNNI